MRKTLAVLFLTAVCALFFYQWDTSGPDSGRHSGSRQVVLPESSGLERLQAILPHAVFRELVQPFLEKNRSSGLTEDERDAFLDELEKIGDALGGKTKAAVSEMIDRIDPQRKDRGLSAALRLWAGEKAGLARDGLPSWKELLKGTLHALEKGIAFLLNKTADLLEGK